MRGSQTAEVEAVEIRLEVQDRRCLLVTASDRLDCRIELTDLVQRSDGSLLEFFRIQGAGREDVLEAAQAWSATAHARWIRGGDDGDLYEFVVTGPCVASTLADVHAIPREVSANAGRGRVVALVPPGTDAGRVVDAFQARHPQSRLLARKERTVPAPLASSQEFRNELLDGLTERQLEVLKSAFARGYFDRPRSSTASEVAASLDVSQSTFSQHVQDAQRKLMAALLQDKLSLPADRREAQDR